ncbi:hypothetical protein ACFYZU_21540 [Streptomyces sp. NPDC001651]|uniref:hypothetical protein n=1 Tax=unclassified Streptomyces TaxID=2593676 RepID=UPI0036C671B1
MSLDLAINLGASLIAFLIGWLARNLLTYYRNRRPVVRLCQIERHAPVTAVVGTARDRRTIFEADALAAMNIRLSLTRDLKIHSIGTVRSSAFNMAGHADDNLVVIGGPAMNEVWKTYASRLDAPYVFQIVGDHYRIVARAGGASFGEARGANGEVEQDHALVIFAWNPFEPRSRLIMMAGCAYPATMAAPAVLSPDFARQLTRRIDTSEPFALVLSVEDVNGYVPKPKIVAWEQFTQQVDG